MTPNAPPFDASRIRSLLFVPMLQARLIAGAAGRGADAVILDLEDAVAPEAKDRARDALAETARTLAEAGQCVLVRINTHPDLIDADLAAANDAAIAGIVLPKAERPDAVATIAGRLDHPALVPLVETALGVINAHAIAGAAEKVAALAFGTEDFCLDMGIPPEEAGLAIPAQQVAIAARAAGKAAFGLPGSLAIIDDGDRFTAIARTARSIGMSGALCVHPRQVTIVNAVFAPTPAEIEEAETVRAAYETARDAGDGAVAVDGRMIDQPVYRRALETLARVRD